MKNRFRFLQSLQGKFLLGMCASGMVLVCLTLLFALSWKYREMELFPGLYLIVLISLLVLVIPGLLIHQSIVRRLQALIEVTRSVGAGNLSESVDVEVHDEIGELADAFNEMTLKMRQTILETKQGREFLENILNNIELGIAVIDNQFRVIIANRAYFGDTEPWSNPEEICCFMLNKHDYDCRMICPARTSFKDGRSAREVHRHEKEDGSEVVVEVFSTPLFNDAGEVNMAILVSKDITQQLEMEKKLLRSDRMALVGQMASGLAHEIKNPIAGISAAIQIISQSLPDADPNREIFDEIQRQIERMKRTLSDLLSYAKPRKPQFVDCDINSLIRRSVALMEPNAKSRGVTVMTGLQDGLPPCRVDPDMIQQVLLNLGLNAIQAQPDGGKVWLQTSFENEENHLLVITLKDEGPGIPPQIMKKIFDPFFTTKHTGTGLGLPISDQILEDHEGMLEVDSTPGKGTTCRIRLPISKDANVGPSSQSEA